MPKNLHINDLFDLYGALLTQKQQNYLTLYYGEDLSLSEIVENLGGTRQGALENIKRAENKLLLMEQHLGLYEKGQKQGQLLNQLRRQIGTDNPAVLNLLQQFEALI